MKKILVASANKKIIDAVKNGCADYSSYFDTAYSTDTDEAVSFIDYELPELKVLDFTSPELDSRKILAAIHADPWLHNGGIIAVVSKPVDVQEIEEQKDPNILVVQTLYTFVENFSRLLRILWSNQQFLFIRGMQDRIGGIEKGSFICGNDPMDIRIYTSLLVSYLYCSNRICYDDRFKLQTTLMELLTNALEHGNCAITYEEKTEYLESGGNILDLIRKKNSLPEIAAKKIHISYLIGKQRTVFRIRDEGAGFDWRSHLKKDFSEETHGRGMKLSLSLVESMSYNDAGNEVTFEILNQKDEANTVPSVMVPFTKTDYAPKQIVCRENELTNDLFFIVRGRYAVYANNKLVSVLTPNDMFIGEMSFLLNDRRSASILSVDNGTLIAIPKASFLNLIRKNPHYGLFLSKLLAQRLLKQTQKTLVLSAELSDMKQIEKIPETLDV